VVREAAMGLKFIAKEWREDARVFPWWADETDLPGVF
jgi:hypothetical protein